MRLLLPLIAACMLLPAVASAQLDSCVISGVAHDLNGNLAQSKKMYLKRVTMSGRVFAYGDKTITTSSVGAFSFKVPRSVGTDTVRIYLQSFDIFGLKDETGLIVPHTATATFGSLQRATAVPPGYLVVIPPQGADYGDSIRVADSLARVARAEAATAQAAADSARAAVINAIEQDLGILNSIIDTLGDATRNVIEQHIATLSTKLDSMRAVQVAALETRDKALTDILGGKGDSDSLKAVYDSLANVRATLDGHATSIAAAGKWTQFDAAETYKVLVPKFVDSSVFKMDNFGNTTTAGAIVQPRTFHSMLDSMTIYKPLTVTSKLVAPRFTFAASGGTNYYIDHSAFYPLPAADYIFTNKRSGTGGIKFGTAGVDNVMYLSPAGKLGVGVMYPANSAEFGGNVRVNPDSALIAGNINFVNAGLSLRRNASALNLLGGSFGIYMPSTESRSIQFGSQFDSSLFTITTYGAGFAGGNASWTVMSPKKGMATIVNTGGISFNAGYFIPTTNRIMHIGTRGKVAIGYDEAANRLEVAGNISQAKDSTADLGKIRTPQLQWDTLGVQQGDTLQWYVKEVENPITVTSKAVSYASVKQGYVKFKIPADASSLNTGAFKTDSAAGVRMQVIYEVGVGGRSSLWAGANYQSAVITVSDVSASSTVNWGLTSAAKVPRLRGVGTNPGDFIRPFSIMGTGGVGTEGVGTIEATVYFIMPAANTSSWYITIVDL